MGSGGNQTRFQGEAPTPIPLNTGPQTPGAMGCGHIEQVDGGLGEALDTDANGVFRVQGEAQPVVVGREAPRVRDIEPVHVSHLLARARVPHGFDAQHIPRLLQQGRVEGQRFRPHTHPIPVRFPHLRPVDVKPNVVIGVYRKVG